MSHLRLFPSREDVVTEVAEADAVILPFQPLTRTAASIDRTSAPPFNRVELLLRARRLQENRSCPHCQHPVVQPLELADSLIGRGNLPIPGSGTLVGFRCESCRAEWPA